ncbi:hypothetical protein ACQCV8_13515 [Metabacillus sp. 84]
MNYPLMDPPFNLKDFDEMTKKEAQNHFDWYTGEIPARLRLLKQAYTETSEGKLEDLDLSPHSLVNLWTWFLSKIEIEFYTADEIADKHRKLPEWLHKEVGEKKLSTATLCVAMDIGIYFGEVFVKNFNHLNWGVKFKPKSYAHVNRPVILGFSAGKQEMNPSNLIHNLSLEAIEEGSENKSLYNLFKVWEEDI